jgi:uncharacterized protein YjbI with pentapeptide repeats
MGTETQDLIDALTDELERCDGTITRRFALLARADLADECLRVDLWEANLRRAGLLGAGLEGAKFVGDTILPNGTNRMCDSTCNVLALKGSLLIERLAGR